MPITVTKPEEEDNPAADVDQPKEITPTDSIERDKIPCQIVAETRSLEKNKNLKKKKRK